MAQQRRTLFCTQTAVCSPSSPENIHAMCCSLLSTVYAANFAGRYFANSSSLQTFMKCRYENLPTSVRYQGIPAQASQKRECANPWAKGIYIKCTSHKIFVCKHAQGKYIYWLLLWSTSATSLSCVVEYVLLNPA